MFSSNSRSHQRPFGWGLSGPSAGTTAAGGNPQPPTTPSPAAGGAQPLASTTAASSSSSTAGTRPASANNAVSGGGSAPSGGSNGSAAFFRSQMLQNSASNNNANKTGGVGPSSSTAAMGSGIGPQSSTLISSTIPQRSLSAGAATSSAAAAATAAAASSSANNSATSTTSGLVVASGSALNATRATHNNGGGGQQQHNGIGGITATGSIGGGLSSTNPYAPFITGGGTGGTTSANNSNPNSARGDVGSALNTGRSSYHGGGGGPSSAAGSHHHQGWGVAMEPEEDYSKAQMTPAVAALRATNIVSPSGMTAEQTQRLAAMLGDTTMATIMKSGSSSAKIPPPPPQQASESTDVVKVPLVGDDRAQLQSTLKARGVSNGQLAVGEVHTKLRLFDLFHYWSNQRETQQSLKSLTEEALKQIGGGSQNSSSSSAVAAGAGGGPRTSPRGPTFTSGVTSGGTSPRPLSTASNTNNNTTTTNPTTAVKPLGITGGIVGTTVTTINGAASPLEDSTSRPVASSSLLAHEANKDSLSPSIPSLRPDDEDIAAMQSARSHHHSSYAGSAVHTSRRAAGANANGNTNNAASIRSGGGGSTGSPRSGGDAEEDPMPLLSTQREEVAEPIEEILGTSANGGGETPQRATNSISPPASPSKKEDDETAMALGRDFAGMSIDVTPPRASDNTIAAQSQQQQQPIPSTSSPTASPAVGAKSSSSAAAEGRHARSPRSGHVSLPCPPSANASLEGSVGGSRTSGIQGFHIVDEVDAAHARGGLSPRVGSNIVAAAAAGKTSSTTDISAVNSSLNGSFVRNAASASDSAKAAAAAAGGATPLSRSGAGTPNRTRSPVDGVSPHHAGASNSMLESNQARPPSPLTDSAGVGAAGRVGGAAGGRSPSPSLRESRDSSYVGNSTDVNKSATGLLRTNSATGQRPNIPKASTPRGGNNSRAHSPAPTKDLPSSSVPAPPPAKKYATYDDIPRFYFGDGRPDNGRSATIAAPHYKYHENPHLRSFDGIAIPPAQLEQIKAAAAAAEAEKKANGGGATEKSPATKKKGKNAAAQDTSPTKAGNKEAANSESFSLSTLDPAAFAGLNIPQPGYRLAPMMPLVVMEDQDVGTFIQREFAKVPAHPGPAPTPIMPPAGAGAAAGRTTSAGKGTRALAGKKSIGGAAGANAPQIPTNAAAIAAHTKAEAAYRSALHTAMTNIVTQAYGLPKYFTPMVMKRLIVDLQQQQQSSSSASAAAAGSTTPSTDALSAAAGGATPAKAPNATPAGKTAAAVPTVACVEGVPVGVITAALAKEFYERYMRFCAPIRRFFNALVVCNLANEDDSAGAGSSPAAGGGGAASKNPSSLAFGGGGTSTTSAAADAASSGITSSSASSASAASPLKRSRNYLIREDFVPYLDGLLELHPGLAFLRQTADFQVKYVETILVRLFFECDTHDKGRISWPEFERSKLPDAIRQVEVAEDINAVLNFFSYEHFYVIYCRFWELDADRDMLIDANDLAKYFQEGTANSKVIERIFQGHGRKLMAPPAPSPPSASGGAKGAKATTLAAKRAAAAAAAADPAGIANKRMGYEDFVWFCLAEEDKTSPRAIRYWFKVLDLDADGVICGWELEQFYNCTKDAMIAITSECISFEDIMCQIVDMVPALSEGHSALDRSFDRQRAYGGASTVGGAPSPFSPLAAGGNAAPLRTVSLSDKVRRRSSLTAGPLALPLGPNNASSSSVPPLTAKKSSSSPPPTSPLSPIAPVIEDPRSRYHRYGLTLRDLLASPESAHVALNMVLNVIKFLMFEQKDPFVSHHDRLMGGYEGTEWDRFARGEYDRMAAEADE